MRGGGPRLRAARMLSSTDLQLILLALLEQRPRHGYDLIKAIQELSVGAYVPSPGMVYPALSYLEELGHIVFETDGAKKLYRLADPGLVVLNANRPVVAARFDELRRIGQRLQQAREAYDRPLDVGADGAAPAAGAALDVARRELKAALFDALDASPEEQQRVADILMRTVAEIRRS
jgi:DNA-binding PadR family transcriptional regulator